MRRVTNSVVVCTSEAAETEQGQPVPLGLTMSSFTTLSLAPSPIVTFNIAMPSRTEAAIADSRHFMVHILSGDAAGAGIADLFRSGNADVARIYRGLVGARCEVVRPAVAAQEDGAAGQSSRASLPFLRGPGILSVLRCRLLEEPSRGLLPVRDHVIVLGEVLEMIDGEQSEGDGLALIYTDRHYRYVGDTMARET